MTSKLQVRGIQHKNESVSVAENEASRAAQPQVRPGQVIFGIGGSGTENAFKVGAVSMVDGSGDIPVIYTLDNAASVPNGIILPDGRELSFPPYHGKSLYLNTYDNGMNRRDELRRYPLLQRLFEEQGLLRGYSVTKTDSKGGSGGAGYPVMSYADLLLKIAEVRIHVRSALRAATGGDKAQQQGLVFGPVVSRQTRRNNTVHAFVYAGGAGSCGAGISPTMGYIIQDEARALGLTVIVWLILTGPYSYAGFTKRTLASYGATITTLKYLAEYGYHMQYIDGTEISSAAPPYAKVLLVDERLPTNKEGKVEQAAHDLFGWRVAALGAALTRSEVRARYMDAVVGLDDDSIFSTAQASIGGFAPELLQRLLEAEFAVRRARALTQALATHAGS